MKKFEKFWEILSEIVVFLAIAIYLLIIINANWPFIEVGSTFNNILNASQNYIGIALIAVVGFKVTAKRNFFVKIIFYVCIAAIIIFQFFPGTWDHIIGFVGNAF